MIGAVLDTAVIVRGLGPKGPGTRLMDAAIAGNFVPITTPRLLDELAGALRRRELRRAFPRPGRIVSLLGAMSLVIEPAEHVHVLRSDAANHLLAAAHAAGAAFLVTWHSELLTLGRFGPTRIVHAT